ncbi:5'-nucleotidase C-terminal domain-containing protein [uncultured Draconibacterium sp.]|uniref:5'-nucleotidase C-terminal domain-containing protein n=1 Tax=uncultured Draconibacterium sp. TaxID=1573823 RepID=UPI0032180C7C
MRQSFSYALLITWVLISVSCKTYFVQESYETKNISVSEDAGVLDSSIVNLYLPYKQLLEKDMNRVISFSNEEMVKNKPESNLTNFLADLLLEQGGIEAKNQGLDVVPVVSFFNYGGIRSTLPKGNITVGNIYEIMPFENEMVYVVINGSKMQEFLDYVAEKGGDSLGGARFKIKDNKAANATINGEVIKAEKSYCVVTNDYVAAGGDGLNAFQNPEQLINSGAKIRDVLIAYLEQKQKDNETILVKPDGRISYE